MLIDHELYEFIYRRSSFEVWKVHQINKLELKTLCALSWYLKYKNRQIVGSYSFIKNLTGNGREKIKIKGSISGLLKKRCIATYEYISCPGSTSYGITELGFKVLIDFEKALEYFKEKFQPIDSIISDQILYKKTA